MLRKRLAALAAAGAVGLSLGCGSLCNNPTLYRLTHPFQRRPEPAEVAGFPAGEGPVLGDCGPFLVPTAPPLGNGSALAPQPSTLPLAPPPRVAPRPLSEPTPYQPLE